MHKGFLKAAVLLGAITVGLGAFGAHSLKKLMDENSLAIYETGVRYQFYHVFALLAAAALFKTFPNRLTIWACRFFILGMILFSGSLYLLSLAKGFEKTQFYFIGAITPLGGLCFICGWIALFFSFNKKEPMESNFGH